MTQSAPRPSLNTRYRVQSRRWRGAWWMLGWDQEQRTFWAQLYGIDPARLRPVYPEWVYTGSTGSGVDYGTYPAITVGDGEGEVPTVDDLVTVMAEILSPAVRATLDGDQLRGEAAAGP
jgi:hypothetical protein